MLFLKPTFSLIRTIMKKTMLLILIVVMILNVAPNCGPKKTDDTCSSQAAVSAITSPQVNSVQAPSPGPNFPLRITVSNLPTTGVSITVKARPEAGGPEFFSETRNTSTEVNDFTITGTPVNVASIVDITVTSSNCSNNNWTGSYRYSRKQ